MAFTLVVLLTPEPGEAQGFEAYEARASRALARHGGRIERRIALAPSPGAPLARELHVVVFPDRAAFERHRAEGASAELAGARARAIRHTEIWEGEDRPLWPVD